MSICAVVPVLASTCLSVPIEKYLQVTVLKLENVEVFLLDGLTRGSSLKYFWGKGLSGLHQLVSAARRIHGRNGIFLWEDMCFHCPNIGKSWFCICYSFIILVFNILTFFMFFLGGNIAKRTRPDANGFKVYPEKCISMKYIGKWQFMNHTT